MAVNINEANEKEIQSAVPGLGNKAKSLVDYRNQNGEFKSWDDVKKVPGFSEQEVNLMKQKGAMM